MVRKNGIIERNVFGQKEETADELSNNYPTCNIGLACFLVLGVLSVNLFDILIVTYVLYRFTKAIAGTKIMILVRGVLIFVLAQVVANILGLTTISWLINQIITYGVIAAVVIFSPEIRTGLERLGRATDFFSTSQISAEEKMIRAFVKSVEYMSPRKIGALVAIQRVRTLQEYIATGIPLDAKISAELLINIFYSQYPPT